MHELLMATKDSVILPAENAHYHLSDIDEFVSTMDPNSLAATLSVYLEPREPFPVIRPELEPCSNVDGLNISKTDALIDPLNSNENKRSSNRRSTRKSSSNQKNDTKVAARKSRRKYGKKPMVDLLAVDVGRGKRSNLVRRVRSFVWGFAGKIDEIFKQTAEKNGDAKGRTSLKGGKKNTDSVNKSIQNPEGESRPSNKGLLLKLKLGKTAVQTCQLNTIPDMEKDLESYGVVKFEASCIQSNIKENDEKEVYRASNENLDKGIASLNSRNNNAHLAEREQTKNRSVDPGTSPDSEVINVIPDAQINGNITQDIRVSSKDCISHHSDDCGVASGIPSPEIVNDVISCEKQIEGSWPSMDMSTAEGVMKADGIIAGIESIESRSNGQHFQISSKSKSSVYKDTSSCHEKASPAKPTATEYIKEKSYTISHPVTVEMNDARGLEEGSRSPGRLLSNSTAVPQSAWVCCDDCHKWRRISASLADAIDATGCRWICKDNMDKDFADCLIPQEMSNADINAELELSDCEEDACNNNRMNSSQLAQKQPTELPQPSWKLIKTNMFLHRNRKNQSIDEVMVCHCKPSIDGRTGCRDECLNRMLNIECVKGTCPCGDLCSNQQFQKRKYCKLKCFPTGKKGFGLQLQEDIPKGRFLIEYVGEVLDMPSYEARQKEYAKKGHRHFYFMTLNGSEVIDACAKGNLGRFINHSCEPNCRTEKWMVNGEVCIGLFAIRDIKKGEELTFDYNYVRVFGAAAKKCVCGSSRCRGVIGGDPLNDETVVADSDDEYPQPVTFYDNNNKLDNAVSATFTTESNVINDRENNRSPDSLFYPDEKTDDLATPVESTEREISLERSSSATSASESKTEHFEELLPSCVQPRDTSFILESKLEEQNEVDLLPEDSDVKKKPKSHTNAKKCTVLKPKSRSKVISPSSVVKKGKSKSKQTVTETKPIVAPQKPKKIVVDKLTGRFEAVEEALNSLLTKGGISKRRDSSKGYLTLLCLTANGGNGEGIQSNRDLSMILDALLRTKSRTVLLDIINKNGLQMLHILLKRYRKVFNKTPILRKLLKVLEYLAEIKVLTVQHILKSSLPGVESFKESILSLTEHIDKEVHQIARNFRDRYIPRYARRGIRAERDPDRKEFQQNLNLRSFPLQQRKPSEVTDNSVKQVVTPPVEGPSASSLSSSHTDGTRTRKRKSRWDEPGDVGPDTQSPPKKELKSTTGPSNMDVDAPPGFCPPSTTTHHCKTATGQPQDRYNSRLPTSFGLPCSLLKRLGTPNGEGAPADSWEVAPGMAFHPFPPLPSYPRGENRQPKEESWRNGNFQREDRNPNTLGGRYFKQQKWNYPRSGGDQQWNPHKYGPAGFSGPNPDPNQPNLGFGYGRNEADGTYNTGNNYYHHYHHPPPPPPYH